MHVLAVQHRAKVNELNLRMTLYEALRLVRQQLNSIYEEGEAQQIGVILIEHLTGLSRPKISVNSNEQLTDLQQSQLKSYIDQLLKHIPIQYAINEAWFCGLKFYVDESVLIPRPETEELVEWIISECKFPIAELKIIDLGTGSGCIPVSLKRRLRKAEVAAVDISKDALEVAKRNASELGADVSFYIYDLLKQQSFDQDLFENLNSTKYDIIVSNPPYIPESDSALIAANVKEHEPALALFVPDNDALLFYKAILGFADKHLNVNGSVFVEVHEDHANETSKLFEESAFVCEIKRDMQGKQRMMRCIKQH